MQLDQIRDRLQALGAVSPLSNSDGASGLLHERLRALGALPYGLDSAAVSWEQAQERNSYALSAMHRLHATAEAEGRLRSFAHFASYSHALHLDALSSSRQAERLVLEQLGYANQLGARHASAAVCAEEGAAFLGPARHAALAALGAPLRDGAMRAAELAASMQMPGELERHRVGVPGIAERLAFGTATLGAFGVQQWQDPNFLSAFNRASAVSHALAGRGAIDAGIMTAIGMLPERVHGIRQLSDYGGFLDAVGLTLPRWPRFRHSTAREHRQRQAARITSHRPSRHVMTAKSLVHQHEAYLQEAIDELMCEVYGERWPEERLPRCGPEGRDLLARRNRRGGALFSHADYPHYVAVMTEPEHFQLVFSRGFADAAVVVALMDRARKLRASSHHVGHPFTVVDLHELRTTWAAIKKALRTLEAQLEDDLEY